MNAKIADFGTSKVLMTRNHSTGIVGTIHYAAPEVLSTPDSNNNNNSNHDNNNNNQNNNTTSNNNQKEKYPYDQNVDIYSFAILVYVYPSLTSIFSFPYPI